MTYSNTTCNSAGTALDDSAQPEKGRRHLLRASLALAAGVGLQPLMSDSASADQHAGHSLGPPRSPEKLMGPLQEAIQACLDCHSMCLRTAMTYCLAQGGKHVAPAHLRLMVNCAEICQTSANFMLSDSPLHKRICAACADVCEACAQSCEQLGDMRECLEECRKCEKSCKAMI